eukprot:g15227.t2
MEAVTRKRNQEQAVEDLRLDKMQFGKLQKPAHVVTLRPNHESGMVKLPCSSIGREGAEHLPAPATANEDGKAIRNAYEVVCRWGVTGPLRSVLAAGAIARVRLGDGTTRVCAGELVRWRLAVSPRREHVEERYIDFGSSAKMVPDELVPNWPESVVVLQEGLALPKRVLLELVNTVYAVLVLRGETYHYLHNNFALSANEEESLVDWGIGRPAFAGILLAVGGLMMVLFSEIWRPAVVGTLLVAAATYRIQEAGSGNYAPWKWPLTQAPDSSLGAMRLFTLWLIVLGCVLCAVFLAISMFSFKIGSDRKESLFGMRG